MESQSAVALLVGGVVWLVGLYRRSPELRNCTRMEYWWAVSAFFLPGFGMIADFSIPGIDKSFNLDMRLYPILVMSILMILKSLGHKPIIAVSYLPLLASMILMMTIGFMTDSLAMASLSLIVVTAAVIVPKDGLDGQAMFAGLRISTILLVGLLVLFALWPSYTVLGECRFDKCSLWGLSIGGGFEGNNVGMLLAFMAAMCLLMSTSFIRSIAILAGSFVLIDLTTSRSGLLSWAICGAVYVVGRILANFQKSRLIFVVPVAMMVLILYMAFHPWADTTFTLRGSLWSAARNLFFDHPWFGLGSSYWVGQPETSDFIPNYATHNLALELGVSGGSIALIAVLIAIFGAISRTCSRLQWSTILVVCFWLSGSILEVVSAPGRLYLVPGIFVLVLMMPHLNFPPAEDTTRNNSKVNVPLRGTG